LLKKIVDCIEKSEWNWINCIENCTPVYPMYFFCNPTHKTETACDSK
jgi:hypothetical protein